MSVDFYVAVPAANWPSATAVEQCMTERAYPVKVERFPAYNPKRTVNDGSRLVLDGDKQAYLEGELSPAMASPKDANLINDRIGTTGDFRVTSEHALMSIRVRSDPAELRAAGYLISGLVVCYGGYGFEPQGNTHGRESFSQPLLAAAEALKDE